MSAIKSLLKAGIDALDDKAVVKGASVPNTLKKMGVKDEEVKFSGVLDDIEPGEKYSKENLQKIVAGRKDEFGKVTNTLDDEEYNWISLPEGVDNPTYKENIYTFKSTDQVEETRYNSSHFRDVPNYLMHTRTFDTDFGGVDTRVLQEIQSDLHQQGRAKGYSDSGVIEPPSPADVQDLLDGYSDAERFWAGGRTKATSTEDARAIQGRAVEDLKALGLDAGDHIDMFERDAIDFIDLNFNSGIPESPYEKSWLAKGIERTIDGMLSSGKSQLAIPIKGGNVQKQLHRTDGPQKFYETQVLSTAKKIAKQNDMDFEAVKVTDNSVTKAQDLNEEAVNDAINSYPMSDAMDNFSFEDIDPAELQSALVVETDDFLETMHMHGIGTQGFAESMARSVSRNYEANMGEDLPDTVVGQVEQYFTTMVKNLDANKSTEIEYAVLKPKAGGSKTNMKLYSSPAAAVGASYLYLKDGNDPAGLSEELEGMGYEQDDIQTILADAQAVQQAVADGYSEDEALAYIQGQEKQIDQVVEAPPSEESILDRIDQMAKEHMRPATVAVESLVNPNTKLEPEDLLAKLKVIQPNMTAIATRFSSYHNDKVSFGQVELANRQTAQRVVDLFDKRGISVEWHQTPNKELGFLDHMGGIGKYYTRDEEGNLKELDEGFWNALKAERSEIGYGVVGGIAGAKLGARAARVAKNPWVVGASTLAGSIIGAAGGATIGTEIDYLRESIELSEEMSGKIALHKATTAAEASVIGDTIGFGVFKSAGAIWQGIKRTKDLVLDGNIGGAVESLKQSMFITDSEARDLAIGLQQVSSDVVPDGKHGQIAGTLLTKPGGEAIVSAAAAIDPQAAASVSKAIDSRARDALASTAELTEENAGRILVDDLSNYTHQVKKFYGDVKTQVAESPRLNKFQWDFDKLAITPVLDTLEKNISDPAVLERFVLQASRIRSMSDSRNLVDLIELRQVVNDFKFNKRITKQKDFKALNDVLNNVDSAIEMGAGIVMKDPKSWKQSFAKSKAKYAQMKGIERNVITKAVNRPGVSNEVVVKNLAKYITSLDGSFQDIMTAMPMTSRPGMEGAVIDTLANKFADGLEDGMRVIHYPALSKELDKISFTTPEARKAKAAIQQMANVFKNDVNLANATGSFQLPKMQSYLTADPVMRAKYEFASSAFNYVKRMAPTTKSNNLALVMQAAKVLEQPLHAKSMKELMDGVAGDVNLTKQAMLIQQHAAREAAEGKVSPKIHFYGEGNVLSVKGKGNPTSIARHLIATYEEQKRVADTYGIDYNDKKKLALYLKQEGFEAMQQGSDSIRRIK